MINYIKYALILIVSLAHSAAANIDPDYNLTSEIAACIASAAHQHNLDPLLLLAVKYVETADRTDTPIRYNKNGSWDIGLMQINTVWRDTLHRYGIDYNDLEIPCTNIAVGAWILANNIKRKGLWEGVGAYHSSTAPLSQRYRTKVKEVWQELQQLNLSIGSGN
ncbi:MAG: lytic transglycosylase domain-containing protein [Chromatiales bacterium]|nr:lytic transglycosylase domain-containing protein [Chromatiales bacterium]